MASFIAEAVADIQAKVGGEHVILGLSGGVDSSVAAALLHKALGPQLTCIFVDNGLLRKNEAAGVKKLFGDNFKMDLCFVDAADRFLGGTDEAVALSVPGFPGAGGPPNWDYTLHLRRPR